MSGEQQRRAGGESVVEDVFDSSAEAMVAFDEHGRVTAWNRRAAEMFGYAREQALGQDLIELLVAESERLGYYHQLQIFLATGDEAELTQREELTLVHADGSRCPAEMTLSPRQDPAGGWTFHAFFRDLAAHERARRAEERLEAVMDASGDPIVTTDRAGLVTSWNQAAANLYGYSSDEVCGRPLADLFPAEHREEIEELLDVVNTGGQVERMETERQSRGGVRVPVVVSASPLRDAAGAVTGMNLIEHDISEIKRFEDQLQYLAEHDPVTGLHNRRRFQTELEARLAVKARGAVLLVDVDHFKLINDAHGHEVGDRILHCLTDILRETADEGDELAHFGRDEFALLISGETNEIGARSVKILSAIESRASAVAGHHITASLGAVRFGGDENSADGLLICADLALHTAKERGGARYVVYDPQLMNGIRQVERLQRALAEERLVLYSQPILSLSSGRISGCELLLRMRDGGDVVSPANFLTAAERLGLIGAVDQWVIERGIRYAASTQKRVEINLSGQSMTSQTILNVIEHELSVNEVDPRQIIFEITETAAVASMEEAMRFAARLRQLGCQFALDDFGTGFGSFIYLKQLPVSVLKIDGEFIRNLAHSDVNQAVVRAIVSVARDLDKKTVAEWVDDASTVELLRELGVDYAQGYHIGQPAPLETEVNGEAEAKVAEVAELDAG